VRLHFAGPGERERLPEKNTLFICGDEKTRARLDLAGARTALIDDNVFLLPAESPVKPFCLKAALAWYRGEDGADLTEFRGVSLGKTFEGLIWVVVFAPIYKFAHAARALLQEQEPSEVVAETSLPGHRRASLETLCRERGIALRWLETPAEPSAWDAPRAFSTTYSKWPLAGRSAARRALNRVLPFFSRPKGKRVLVSYYYTLERLVSALGAEEGVSPVFYDWAGRRLTRLAGWTRWRFLEAPADSGLDAKDRARLDEILRNWDALCASPEFQARFALDGLSCWEPARAAMRRLVVEDFPFVAGQHARLQAALDAAPPELVVVPYDASPPERLLLQEARRRGIPSALFVHGVACAERPWFFDIEADHAFIGGAALGEFFAAARFPAERVHDTGFPLFDAYAARRREPAAGGPARILVISSFFPVLENIVPIVELLGKYPGIEAVIKLHPGESLEHYRRLLGSRLDGRFTLEVSAPMAGLLQKTDLVIGAPSTALVEAMALGIPVLLTNFQDAAMTPPFDGRSGLALHRTPDELAAALAALLPDRIHASADYKAILDRFAGALDGKAAARGVSALLDILRARG
jgi:hypothetical protein